MIDPRTNRRVRLGLTLGLGFGLAAAAPALAQPAEAPPLAAPPVSGVDWDAPAPDPEAAPEARPGRGSRAVRARTEIQPYLEVAQVVSTELDGGDTLTYTSVAAGVDGRVQSRRVSVQLSYRYQRNIEWEGDVGDQDVHSGVAMLSAQVVPGLLQFDAGALATRTGGEGRALGITDRDASVEVYSAFAGPSLTTQAGPVNVNAAYRLGYVAIDDDTGFAGPREDYDSATAHAASASVGMAPGRLPVGWGVHGAYQRTDSDGDFDHEFEGSYVRADVVVPVGPTLALTGGVGYENIEASQYDLARNADGTPVIDADGDVVADRSRPRVLTYDIDGIIYDAGFIWRPTARTTLEARAGHRYGGTTFVGSLSHQLTPHLGLSAAVFDTVGTFGGQLVEDLSNLPDDFTTRRNPLTNNLGGCVFGAEPGRGVCLDRTLQSTRGDTFRIRGGNVLVSGTGRVWSWGAGANYTHRRYGRDDDGEDLFGRSTDENFSLYATTGRRLSRTASLNFDAYASWFDTNEIEVDRVFSIGTSASYSRSFMLERLRMLAALGLNHSDDGETDSTIASGLVGLSYVF